MKKANLVLYNGTVITMNPAAPFASAVAIKGERIAWVGDQADVNPWIGKDTQTIDLKGACVYPGFIDTHANIIYTGVVSSYLQLLGKSKHEILEEVPVLYTIVNGKIRYKL